MKRAFDILFSLISLAILFPLLAIIMILVQLKLGRPVFFRQQRPGLNGTPFYLFKFRTMTDDTDEAGQLLPDNKRLTGFGRWLRMTSLDELPELWNILNGEMSFVGPRPLRMDYLQYYSEQQARRHDVKPGITGWAQVNGRNSITWEEKFELDVWYVENQSIWLDFKILFLTLKQVLSREGINYTDDQPMPKFRGSQTEKSGTIKVSDDIKTGTIKTGTIKPGTDEDEPMNGLQGSKRNG